jgi:hypothetical protein
VLVTQNIHQQLTLCNDILINQSVVDGFLATSPSAEDASKGLMKILYKPDALQCCRLGLDADRVPLDERGIQVIHSEKHYIEAGLAEGVEPAILFLAPPVKFRTIYPCVLIKLAIYAVDHA